MGTGSPAQVQQTPVLVVKTTEGRSPSIASATDVCALYKRAKYAFSAAVVVTSVRGLAIERRRLAHSRELERGRRNSAEAPRGSRHPAPHESYFEYCEQTRTRLSLRKNAPVSRPVQPVAAGRIVEIPQVGGLHHRDERIAACVGCSLFSEPNSWGLSSEKSPSCDQSLTRTHANHQESGFHGILLRSIQQQV
jgi:hypothetical protein